MPIADSTRAAIFGGARRHLKFSETGSDIDPYGYLAGLTNHTAALRSRVPSRFVIARTADGVIAESRKKLIEAIEARYDRALASPSSISNEPIARQIVDRKPDREREPSR